MKDETMAVVLPPRMIHLGKDDCFQRQGEIPCMS